MKIEKNDMVMVYDGGGTVPHCKYTGRFGDLTAYWQEIVSDAVYLFRLREIFAGADEVIGYNVGFDLGFLSAVGVRPREDARITDTMNLFTWFMGRRYKLVDAADHIGYEWTGRAHGSLADALATLAVQRWLEQWLVAE